MKKTKKNSVLISLLSVVLLLVLIVVGYVAYVFIAYYRIEDNLALAVDNNSQKTVQTDTEYSIMTWNIGFGAYSDDYSFFMDGGKYSRAFSAEAVDENVSEMMKVVKAKNPDIAIIQEVDIGSTRSYGIDEREIVYDYLPGYASVFAQNYDSPYLFYPILSPHGKSRSGIMTETKFNILNATRRSLPVESGFTKLLDLDRCYSVSYLPVSDGKTLCVYNMHLSAYTTDGTIATEQLQMLVEDMQAEYSKGNYIICGGDFNKDLLGNSSEVFGVSGEDLTWAQPIPDGVIPDWLTLVACSNAPSCRNADRPYDDTNFVLTIDGFLVSGNIDVVTAEVIDEAFAHSDHNPVIMQFKLKG